MSRLVGVVVGCGFAAVWAYHGLSSYPGIGIWAYGGVVPSALIVGRATRIPQNRGSVEWDKVKNGYFKIVALEVLAMVLLTNTVAALGRPELIWPGLAVIVGVHFIPLARLFGSRVYLLTAALLTSLGLVAPVLPGLSAQLILGLGAALTLWVTAVVAPSAPTAEGIC